MSIFNLSCRPTSFQIHIWIFLCFRTKMVTKWQIKKIEHILRKDRISSYWRYKYAFWINNNTDPGRSTSIAGVQLKCHIISVDQIVYCVNFEFSSVKSVSGTQFLCILFYLLRQTTFLKLYLVLEWTFAIYISPWFVELAYVRSRVSLSQIYWEIRCRYMETVNISYVNLYYRRYRSESIKNMIICVISKY